MIARRWSGGTLAQIGRNLRSLIKVVRPQSRYPLRVTVVLDPRLKHPFESHQTHKRQRRQQHQRERVKRRSDLGRARDQAEGN
jgi:hypothetical protein